MAVDQIVPLAATGETVIAAVAVVVGAGIGAVGTGLVTALTSRTDRGNKWLEFERGHSRGFMQHIAVHRRGKKASEEDKRLIGHYYTLALAVGEDEAATALYQALPDDIRERVHDPRESPFSDLRSEVTPGRRALAPPGETTA
jgi:hypothetical protein